MRELRILMVLHMPWDRNLGGPRVQIELADEFRSHGHIVDKFDFFDAFPEGRYKISRMLAPLAFSARARDYIRRSSKRYDIVDAHHGNLPFTKGELKFDGLLVARSGGLCFFYDDFERFARKRWPAETRTRAALLRRWQSGRELSACLRSLQEADVLIAQNADEQAYLANKLGFDEKTIVARCGLSSERAAALYGNMARSSRVQEKEIVFIGQWGLRKGSADWGTIVRRVWAEIPAARFAFLGTGCDEQRIFKDLAVEPCSAIRVVPRFETAELPTLLVTGTVGAFPSYIEGFGIAILELLAAGLPTVAYDVPGPRETLTKVDPALLIQVGNAEAVGAKLIELLRLVPSRYHDLALRCVQAASHFRWSDIAITTLEAYSSGLARIRTSEPANAAQSWRSIV
jgi:glycosyltransferase involved in cell wall biosynthesis